MAYAAPQGVSTPDGFVSPHIAPFLPLWPLPNGPIICPTQFAPCAPRGTGGEHRLLFFHGAARHAGELRHVPSRLQTVRQRQYLGRFLDRQSAARPIPLTICSPIDRSIDKTPDADGHPQLLVEYRKRRAARLLPREHQFPQRRNRPQSDQRQTRVWESRVSLLEGLLSTV